MYMYSYSIHVILGMPAGYTFTPVWDLLLPSGTHAGTFNRHLGFSSHLKDEAIKVK
jgi:hypothetical protein